MPSLQDSDDIRLAIESQAHGKLEEYARNPDLLEERRRESLNYPLPPGGPELRYTTASMQALQSTGMSYAVLAQEEEVYRRYESILQRDITLQDVLDYERLSDDSTIRCAYVAKPAARYSTEKRLEMIRIDSFKEKDGRCSKGTREWLAAMDRSKQEALARHFIRQRWETIGVWNNNQWNLKPSPTAKWEWPWLPGKQVASRILELTRQAIGDCGSMSAGCYGESVEDRASNQTPQISWNGVEGDDFIGSRPWFAFEIECIVEATRRWILPTEAKELLPTEAGDFIRRQWIEKGIWNDEWSFQGRQQEEAFVGWRWKMETPEPPHADMGELNGQYEMDFTESEEEEIRRIKRRIANMENTDVQANDENMDVQTNNENTDVQTNMENTDAQTNNEMTETMAPGPRRSARIAALHSRRAAASQAAQDSLSIPQTSARRRREAPRPLRTRIQPERRGKGKHRADNTEDTDRGRKSKGRATKRRRRG